MPDEYSSTGLKKPKKDKKKDKKKDSTAVKPQATTYVEPEPPTFTGRHSQDKLDAWEGEQRELEREAELHEKYDYTDYETGEYVSVDIDQFKGTNTKEEEASGSTRQQAATTKADHEKKYNDDPEYRRAYDAGELDGDWGDKIKGWGDFALDTASAVVEGGAILGAAYGATALTAALTAPAATSVTGLGASLHGTGAAIAPLGTAGAASGATLAAGAVNTLAPTAQTYGGVTGMETAATSSVLGSAAPAATGVTGLGAMETAVASGTAGTGAVAAPVAAAAVPAIADPVVDVGAEILGDTGSGGEGGLGSVFDTIQTTLDDNEGIIGLGMDIVGGVTSYNQNQDAQDTQKEAFEMQNPWAENMEWAGDELMKLLEDPDSIKDSSRYKFQLDQGTDSLNAANARSGHRFSGRAMEEAQIFGQDLAGQMYNEEIDRWSALAGANYPVQGGTEYGNNMNALTSQGNFDTTYTLNKILTGGGGDTSDGAIDSQYYWNN